MSFADRREHHNDSIYRIASALIDSAARCKWVSPFAFSSLTPDPSTFNAPLPDSACKSYQDERKVLELDIKMLTV
jgi:hypothetical protein